MAPSCTASLCTSQMRSQCVMAASTEFFTSCRVNELASSSFWRATSCDSTSRSASCRLIRSVMSRITTTQPCSEHEPLTSHTRQSLSERVEGREQLRRRGAAVDARVDDADDPLLAVLGAEQRSDRGRGEGEERRVVVRLRDDEHVTHVVPHHLHPVVDHLHPLLPEQDRLGVALLLDHARVEHLGNHVHHAVADERPVRLGLEAAEAANQQVDRPDGDEDGPGADALPKQSQPQLRLAQRVRARGQLAAVVAQLQLLHVEPPENIKVEDEREPAVEMPPEAGGAVRQEEAADGGDRLRGGGGERRVERGRVDRLDDERHCEGEHRPLGPAQHRVWTERDRVDHHRRRELVQREVGQRREQLHQEDRLLRPRRLL
eukprot:6211817-Pleurochrysis_carterae.AAC.2